MVLEVMDRSIVVTDSCFMILGGNAAFDRLCGTRSEHSRGKHLGKILAEPAFEAMLQTLLWSKPPCRQVEHELELPPTGERRHARVLEVGVRRLDSSGFLFIMKDYTESRMCGDKLREILDRLASELGKPVSSLFCNGQSLAVEAHGADALSHASAEVREASVRIQRVSRMVGRYAALQDPLPMEKKPLVVRECIEAALGQLRQEYPERAISLAFEAEGQGAGLLGEPELVREMFYHILHNALKFAKVECRILVQCARVEGRTLVCIADNGRGISLHDAERVCEPFFQEPDVPQLFGGVGLGLTLAKQIAEIHGGWITVKGEPEKGVTVAVLV
jgi:signal transduction histidine kinase